MRHGAFSASQKGGDTAMDTSSVPRTAELPASGDKASEMASSSLDLAAAAVPSIKGAAPDEMLHQYVRTGEYSFGK